MLNAEIIDDILYANVCPEQLSQIVDFEKFRMKVNATTDSGLTKKKESITQKVAPTSVFLSFVKVNAKNRNHRNFRVVFFSVDL